MPHYDGQPPSLFDRTVKKKCRGTGLLEDRERVTNIRRLSLSVRVWQQLVFLKKLDHGDSSTDLELKFSFSCQVFRPVFPKQFSAENLNGVHEKE